MTCTHCHHVTQHFYLIIITRSLVIVKLWGDVLMIYSVKFGAKTQCSSHVLGENQYMPLENTVSAAEAAALESIELKKRVRC